MSAENEGNVGAPLASDAAPVADPETTDTVVETANPVGADAGASSPRPSRSRNLLVGLLVVLTCLALLLSAVAIWAHYTVLNTDGYIAVVEPIAQDPETIDALSDYIAAEVMTATNLEARTSEALPPRLTFLAAPISDAVNTFISDQTNELLSTPRAQEIWVEINREAHTRVVALLRGESTYAYIEGDTVKLNTLPLISQALIRVDSKLPGGLQTRFDPPEISAETPPEEAIKQLSDWLGRPLKADAGQVTLLTSEALGPAQTAVMWFDRLVIILPIVTVLLAAATIWLSRRRRRTIIELGIGVAVALVVFYVITKRLSQMLIDRLQSETVAGVAQDIVQASIGPLADITLWVCVAGVVVAFVAWLVGRSDVTGAVVSAGNRAVRSSSPLLAWSGKHADLLRIAGLVIGLILLLLFSWSWPWVILWLVLIGAYQLLISWLAGGWPFARGGDASSDAPSAAA